MIAFMGKKKPPPIMQQARKAQHAHDLKMIRACKDPQQLDVVLAPAHHRLYDSHPFGSSVCSPARNYILVLESSPKGLFGRGQKFTFNGGEVMLELHAVGGCCSLHVTRKNQYGTRNGTHYIVHFTSLCSVTVLGYWSSDHATVRRHDVYVSAMNQVCATWLWLLLYLRVCP